MRAILFVIALTMLTSCKEDIKTSLAYCKTEALNHNVSENDRYEYWAQCMQAKGHDLIPYSATGRKICTDPVEERAKYEECYE